ncbi:hypothetical protein L7F22_044567 [Adiantum nelumboides]|nr:hypothetical protein [Adiantum nelumboides]
MVTMGGMKKLAEEIQHNVALIDAATFGLQVYNKVDVEDSKAYGDLWPYALSTAERTKVPRGKLSEAGNNIQKTIGWSDPMDSLSVYAYIAKSKANEAMTEEKRKRDEETPGTSKRATTSSSRKEEGILSKPTPKVDMEDALKDKKQKVRHVQFNEEDDEEIIPRSHFSRSHWARATTETIVKLGDLEEPVLALVDHGSEINLMAKCLHQKGRWPIDVDHGWRIQATNMLPGDLYGACANVKVTIGDVGDEHNFFIQEHSSYPLILGQPYVMDVQMETKVLNDGSAYARIQSRDGKRAVQFLTVFASFSRSTIVKRDYGGTKEGEISQREAFSSGFLGLTSEGSFRKFNELPKWEKEYISELEEIKQNRLQNGTEVVKVHSMDAYELLLQWKQGFEDAIDVQVETKYKTVAKKVKLVATPLPEGSNEVIEEASRQPMLRDPKNIGHKFIEETLKQLKVGEDGFLTNEEIKCF